MSIGKRDISLDAVAGFLLCVMIAYHNEISVEKYSFEHFFFFVPWFFYKAGMMHVIENLTWDTVLLWSKRYLFPYAIYMLVGWSFYIIHLLISQDVTIYTLLINPLNDIVHRGAFWANEPLWFLMTLFICRVFATLCVSRKDVCYMMICVFAICAFLLRHFHIVYPLYFGNTCLAMFFYLCGYILKNIQYKWWTLIVAIIVYACCYVYYPANLDVRINNTLYGKYLAAIVAAIAGCVIINNLFSFCVRKLNVKFYVLSWIGKNSLPIFCAHWIVLQMVDNFQHDFGMINDFYIVRGIICIISLPLMVVLHNLIIFHYSQQK